MSSKVYYTDFHTTVDEPLTKKLARLILTAGQRIVQNVTFR